MRLRFASLALLVAAGCSSFAPTEERLPPGAVPMAAPAQYEAWFTSTERCAGLQGRFNRIQWYVVPGVETFPTEAGPKVGMWEKSGGQARIIIAGRYQGHEMVVRHEMLHHLLDREGHPTEFFVERCQLTWESWTVSSAAD
jgi:hypothetical protein